MHQAFAGVLLGMAFLAGSAAADDQTDRKTAGIADMSFLQYDIEIREALNSREEVATDVEADTIPYVQSRDVAVCGCAKCGSTSLYLFIYQELFGKEWPYEGEPWVQAVDSPRWESKFTQISAKKLRLVKHTFAVIRDPRDRLISAWKSKFACEESLYRTDINTRRVKVTQLLRLAGLLTETKKLDCLSFTEFVTALHAVHKKGASLQLDHHVLPQQLACFRDMPPSEWAWVGLISAPDFGVSLAEALGAANASEKVISVAHQSAHRANGSVIAFTPSSEAELLLDDVTRDEYEALGLTSPYQTSHDDVAQASSTTETARM